MSDIIINIVGEQVQGEHREKMQITTAGNLIYKNGNGTISYGYAELDAHNDLPEYTEISVEEDVVVMKKYGLEETEFVFEDKKIYTAIYETPFGVLDIMVIPTLVDVKLGDFVGKLELEYILDIGGVQTVNRLNLNYASGLIGEA